MLTQTLLILSLGLLLCPAPVTSQTLGSAIGFGVFAGASASNSGASVVTGDLGVSPGSALTGFTPGTVTGTTYVPPAAQAVSAAADAATCYNFCAGLTPTTILTGTPLDGLTLLAGVYSYATTATLNAGQTLTLDGAGSTTGTWVVQVGSALNSGTGATVSLINGARACRVFWQVGSSAVFGLNTVWKGNVLASQSVSANTGVNCAGGFYAISASVTLIDDLVTAQTGTGC